MKSNKLTKFKRTEIGMIPSDWEVIELGKIFNYLGGYSFNSNDFTENKYYKNQVIRIGNVKNGKLLTNINPVYVTDEIAMLANKYMLKNNIIIFTMTGTRTKRDYFYTYCVDKKDLGNMNYYINQRVGGLIPFDNICSKYYSYVLKRKEILDEVFLYETGSANQGNISFSGLKKVLLYKPPKPEQEKIANTLTRIDNLIEDYEKLIKKKEKIKQGLMQNLLTGKVRLKGYNTIYKNSIIGNVCDIKKGKQINGEKLLNKGKYYMLNGGQEASGYLNDYNTLENTISISEGGNSCGYVNYNKEKFWAGGHLYVVDSLKIEMDTLYFYYLLKHNESSIMQLRKGSGLPNIQKSDLMNFEIYSTDDIKEQEAISQVLLNADNEINDLKIKLNKIIDIKNGMLDNLLTGKIRL